MTRFRRWQTPLIAVAANVIAWWFLAAPSFPATRDYFARHPMLPFWLGGAFLSVNGVLVFREQFRDAATRARVEILHTTTEIIGRSVHRQTELLANTLPVRTSPPHHAWSAIATQTLNDLVAVWRETYHGASPVVNIRVTLYQPRLLELHPIAWSTTVDPPNTVWGKQRGLVGFSYARGHYYFLANVAKCEQKERQAGRRFLFQRQGRDDIAAILSLPIVGPDPNRVYGFLTIDSDTPVPAIFDHKNHDLYPPGIIARTTPALALRKFLLNLGDHAITTAKAIAASCGVSASTTNATPSQARSPAMTLLRIGPAHETARDQMFLKARSCSR